MSMVKEAVHAIMEKTGKKLEEVTEKDLDKYLAEKFKTQSKKH